MAIISPLKSQYRDNNRLTGGYHFSISAIPKAQANRIYVELLFSL
jgi:hypothetical protein